MRVLCPTVDHRDVFLKAEASGGLVFGVQTGGISLIQGQDGTRRPHPRQLTEQTDRRPGVRVRVQVIG